MTSNDILLRRQININNLNIDRLLRLIEENQRENTMLLERLGRQPNEDQALDIMFYTFFPRNTEPEPIIPTSEIISNETSICLFRNVEEPKNNSCPITFEHFLPEQTIMMIDHCGHLFNPRELRQWFRSNSTCPVCRYDICNHEVPPNIPPPNIPTDVPIDPPIENPDLWRTNNFPLRNSGTERNVNNFVSRITNNRLNVNDILSLNVSDVLNVIREDATVDNFINRFRDI